MDKYSVNEQKVHLNARRPAEFKLDSKIVYDMAYKEKLEHERMNSSSPNKRKPLDQSDSNVLLQLSQESLEK